MERAQIENKMNEFMKKMDDEPKKFIEILDEMSAFLEGIRVANPNIIANLDVQDAQYYIYSMKTVGLVAKRIGEEFKKIRSTVAESRITENEHYENLNKKIADISNRLAGLEQDFKLMKEGK